MTNIVTLAQSVGGQKIKGVVLSRLTFEQILHSIDYKHPHRTKQHAPTQTTHTGLTFAGVACEVTMVRGYIMQALPTYKRGIYGVMASREDGLASLCTGYSPILTHTGNTVSPSNWQLHSFTYGMAYNLPREPVDSHNNNSKTSLMSTMQI